MEKEQVELLDLFRMHPIDTNVIIDLFGNKLPIHSSAFIKKLPIVISVITRIELIGKFSASHQYLQTTKSFIENASIYELDEPIILETIAIRQKYKIKLPDAIIAATATINKLTLITHDVEDYKGISNLKILNSWKIPE